MMANRKGIYIHIPFCARKCNYCAFLSAPADDKTRERYVESLIKEIELRAKAVADGRGCPENIDTVYFGGGTPSVLSTEQIGRILGKLNEAYRISEEAEITLEANPGTLGESDEEVLRTLKDYRRMGINRLSMGVQSMDDERLKFLGRIHDSETVKRDFRLAREAGFENINLDIIFSVPGESLEDALSDIKGIASMGPEHISFYSLQLEEGTPLFEMWERREFEEVSDEVDRETYHRGCRLLGELGYEHYEISNFAKEGYRSKHNSSYWDMSEYVGMGLGASGFENGVRYRNLSELEEYESAVGEGRLPVEEEHANTGHDSISEAVFLGLRRAGGVKYAEIPTDDFWDYYRDAKDEAEGFVQSGHLIIDKEGLRLTEAGIDISNKIMALFV